MTGNAETAALGPFVDDLVQWIREQVQAAGAAGTVVALSGGIDAAVTSALCQRAFPEDNLGVILPCHSDPADEADARLFADTLGIPVAKVDLTPVYDTLVAALEPDTPDSFPEADGRQRLALANIKPRLRMTALYYLANKNNRLVVGTENLSELTVGYFTKHGDGGVDILPIAHLVKGQVVQLAEFLGVPERIVRRVPGAGLWAGQTDEAELGMTYDVIDRYILTGEAEAEHKEKIDRLHRGSEHKRHRPPVAPVSWPL